MIEECHRGGLRPVYLTARRGERLAAIAAAHEYRSTADVFTPDHTLLRRFRKPAVAAGLSFLPALVCGPPKAPGRHVRVDATLSAAERERVTEAVVAAIEAEAARRKGNVIWRDLLEDEAPLIGLLRRRGYRIVPTPRVAILDLPPGGFDGYLARLRTRSRNAACQVRRDLRRLGESGASIRELEDVASRAGDLGALAEKHYRRLNGKAFPYTGDLFEKLVRHQGSAVRAFGAFRGPDMVGFTLLLHGQSTAHSMFGGIDRSLPGSKAAHFPLHFYTPIRVAIEAGLERIDYGKQSLEGKLRRGCRLAPTHLAFRSPSPLRNALAAAWFRVFRRSIAGATPAPRPGR